MASGAPHQDDPAPGALPGLTAVSSAQCHRELLCGCLSCGSGIGCAVSSARRKHGTRAGSPGGIFISYRRDDTAWPTVPLFGQLADHFGADRVFRDIDVIKPGDDFAERIQIALASCSVLLALIGEGWLTATDSSGRRRLDLPDDYVRLEIETALARGIVVIPVLVDGARMPRAADLPPGIRGLSGREALTL